jgi:nondiscriminating glutamyl-tRNA synthetase
MVRRNFMIRVRFAPSPTGNVHVGSLRTALYNYLFAKQNKGTFVLRLEDTDRTRYQEGSVENLLHALYTTGVIPDEGLQLENGQPVENGEYGPYIQSERLSIYKKYIQKLLDEGKAYYCFCSKERLSRLRDEQRAAGETPRYDGHCRNLTPEEVQKKIDAGEPYVIRLKLPENTDISFNDVVRGKITINTKEMDDQVLIKEDGFPTYHFAVVIDDHLMKITHVIRGEEWLPSTPKHVYLYQCFGWEPPTFVHLSNILNSDHKKLSKRQGDVAVEDFLEKGYLPEALINFLALLGWSPENDQEIFSMDELEQAFDIQRISNSGAVFDREKLNWMNGQYIKNASNEVIVDGIKPFIEKDSKLQVPADDRKDIWLQKVAELLRDRIDYFAQAPEQLEQILDDHYQIDGSDEAQDILHAETVPILYHALESKIKAADQWNADYIQKDIIKAIQKEHKKEKIKGKMLYMPIRLILTGSMHGPDLALIMDVLGQKACLKRLHHFAEYLKEEN